MGCFTLGQVIMLTKLRIGEDSTM